MGKEVLTPSSFLTLELDCREDRIQVTGLQEERIQVTGLQGDKIQVTYQER
jgi:hypothetical protein